MEVSIQCVYCHQTFNMADSMIEREVCVPERLVLTVLVCPHCNNEIVAQVDNQATLRLHQRQLVLLKKMGERKYHYGKPTAYQEQKTKALSEELIAARNALCGKYNHSSYQFDGKEYKLDIHVPNMTISEV